jgi:hypothetical protein
MCAAPDQVADVRRAMEETALRAPELSRHVAPFTIDAPSM